MKRRRWTDDDIAELRHLAGRGTRLQLIARALKRSPEAVRAQATKLGIAVTHKR